MVFVHGFDERYDDTVYGFAQILHDSGALGEVAPVLFTWPSRVAAKIKLVLLADPDVDIDVSREQIAAMGPDRPHIVLFVSEDDRALAASKEVWGAPRLGAINPDIEPYKSMLDRRISPSSI